MASPQRPRSLLAIWNMSFGFLGIQFGWGLQMANMSAIYQYLGATEGAIPALWLAAPVTGLIVQPLIGHYSDRTWTRLGRRRPYFLGGALAASAALLALPNSSSLLVAAGLLWVLDASVNISMEPFRAFIGDLLPPEQRRVGFAMQSLLIGLGAVLSSALPWLLARLGLAAGGSANGIPHSIHVAFYIGAAAFLACVLYTVATTTEPREVIPAEADEASAITSILGGLAQMPPAMRRLAAVQFFTWLGLFCMWLYFTPAVALRFFGPVGSPAYTAGVEWGGVCIATYNGVAFLVSFILVALARRGVGSRVLHAASLLCAAAGLLTVGLWPSYHLLLISMVGVGIGWAAILSMPYALLANSIPGHRMGFYMGVFNFFVVLPQIVAAALLGPIVTHVLHGRGLPIVVAGGGCFLVAALGLRWVPDAGAPARRTEAAPASP